MYEQGRRHAVLYDDLSKQAAAYRQISLLLRRPPGREAYPGDVFYLHSRLLERACKLAERYVIVADRHAEDAADVKGVDGKVYDGPPGLHEAPRRTWQAMPDAGPAPGPPPAGLRRLADRPAHHRDAGRRGLRLHPDQRDLHHRRADLPGADLFFAGVRPAINVGICVSRVGGKAAQVQAMKEVARACGWTWRPTASWRRSPSSAPNWTRPPSGSSTAAGAWSSCSSSRSIAPIPWPSR